MPLDFLHLTNIAIKAALEAGKVIQGSVNTEIPVSKKEGGNTLASQVVTAIDLECERIILKYLLPTCTQFDIALLSEETEDDGSRFTKDYFWCIDPMDGTLAFINKHPGYSVSIALVAKDGTPLIGVVFDPNTETLYHAIKNEGAFKNQKPWQIKIKNNYLTYVTDKKLSDTPNQNIILDVLKAKTKTLGLTKFKEIAGGGSVLNAIQVIENGPAILLKLPKKETGGGSIWDFAATACIFKELGLFATDYHGKSLKLNEKETTFMNKNGVFYANFNLISN